MIPPSQYVNIHCAALAAEKLGYPVRYHDQNKNFLEITTPVGPKLFINTTAPVNSADLTRLAEDKEFSYKYLSPHIRLPKTIGYFDPGAQVKFENYKTHHSQAEIIQDILANFTLPLMVKMNTGSQGRNVFKCADEDEVQRALKKIYNKRSLNYDYVALAQEFVPIQKEYRVVVLNNEIQFIYEKDISAGVFNGNHSPLHYENARALLVSDQGRLGALSAFLFPLFSLI